MPRNYKKLQEKITFEALMEMLSEEFARLQDHRRVNSSYWLADVLRSAFAMFSLKSPSLLSFKEQTKQEEKNLKAIYHIQSVPGDTQMRAALDPVLPSLLRAIFPKLFNKLSEAGVIKEYEYWKSHVIVSIDGVEHFSSTKVYCDHCTTRIHRNGETSYHHAGLAAVLVHPDQEEVFTLDFEPILNADGPKKNDWLFVLNVKPDSHESLERQFAGRRASGRVKELRITDPQGIKHYFAWTNDLCLCEIAIDVSVKYLLYEQTDKRGKVTRWTWITNIPLNTRSVEAVMRAGRARWKIAAILGFENQQS